MCCIEPCFLWSVTLKLITNTILHYISLQVTGSKSSLSFKSQRASPKSSRVFFFGGHWSIKSEVLKNTIRVKSSLVNIACILTRSSWFTGAGFLAWALCSSKVKEKLKFIREDSPDLFSCLYDLLCSKHLIYRLNQ